MEEKVSQPYITLMMKTLHILIITSCLFIVSCSSKQLLLKESRTKPLNNLHYTIERVADINGNYLKVNLVFRGEDDGTTNIYLPHEWGPAQDLHLSIQNFTCENVLDIIDVNDGEKFLEHNPGEDIMIRYEVKHPFSESKQDPQSDYYPLINEDYFYFLGPSLFVYPSYVTKQGGSINIEWTNFPSDWLIHNSFGTDIKQQYFSWKDSLGLEAVFLGGDYRKHTVSISDKPVHVVLRGNWSFSDEEYLILLKKVIQQQRKFWNDYEFNYYTVTLTPYRVEIPGTSYQGTGLKNAFSMKATPNTTLKDLEYLCNHEMMHEWIGQKIKTAEPEAQRYWFSEGFTDYYTYINMRELGLINEAEYINEMNNIVENYYLSKAHNASNNEIADRMFVDYNTYGMMTYQRGCVFAMYLDWKIKLESKNQDSLKSVMLLLLEECYQNGKPLTDELFISTVNQYLKDDIYPYFKKHIIDGETIELEDWMLGNKTKVIVHEKGVYDIGFDFEASQISMQVIDVNPNSNAYQAGLRDGQSLAGYSLFFGDRNSPIELNIIDDGNNKSIKYWPESQHKKSVPAFQQIE